MLVTITSSKQHGKSRNSSSEKKRDNILMEILVGCWVDFTTFFFKASRPDVRYTMYAAPLPCSALVVLH